MLQACPLASGDDVFALVLHVYISETSWDFSALYFTQIALLYKDI